jgi:hypothetical protein
MPQPLRDWLSRFDLEHSLCEHVMGVMAALPAEVRDALVTDPNFALCDYEPGPNAVMHVRLGSPRARQLGRAVVLKRTLRHRPASFVRYIIAHELAHAHLGNAGRWSGEDPEHAADALAEEWGFPRPA